MSVLNVVGRSIAKAGKYVGLSAAGAAVAAVSGIFDPIVLSGLLDTALQGEAGAGIYIPLIAQLAGGTAGPLLAVALQQIIKHRDKVKDPV